MQQEQANAVEQALRTLLVSGLAGDAVDYRMFLAQLASHLRAYFRRRLYRMPEEAEDLVQETLIAIHNQRHTYDSAQPLTAWVHAIARYKLVDVLRRRARIDTLNDPLDDAHELLEASDEEAAQARRDLGKLLDTLPERQRMPIVYVKLQGLSVAEAARLMGMSVPAVKVAIHRGLKALAQRIRQLP